MHSIQVADQTFVAAPGASVAALVRPPGKWREWWPELTLEVREDRGDKGIRWTVGGALIGTMEIWLEPVLDGVVLHYFLHAEPARPTRDPATANRVSRIAGKRMSFEVKRVLETGRPPGVAPLPAS